MDLEHLQKIIDKTYERATTFTKSVFSLVSAEDLANFLNQTKATNVGILATVKSDESPHVSWRDFDLIEGKLYAWLDVRSLSYRNLMRDGRVAIAIVQRRLPTSTVSVSTGA